MRISISNLAWDVKEDLEVANLLNLFNVDAIDIAPGKYFPEPASASIADIHAVKDWWQERGIDIIGMQALLFGTTGLNVFGSESIQKKTTRSLGCSLPYWSRTRGFATGIRFAQKSGLFWSIS